MTLDTMSLDEQYMQEALDLAQTARRAVRPNPMVGAILVKDGNILARGYHKGLGLPHAEIDALRQVTKEEAEGSTLYVTLEPCCHQGRTPPCTKAIQAAKIKKVVVAMEDPNPKVAGKGLAILREAGVEVVSGVLEAEARKVNEIFIHYISQGLPYVVAKYAMTADGKIATHTGDSQWITGEEARAHVHKIRADLAGIMVGINTVLHDDPLLTARLPQAVQPVRIICDSHLRLPCSSQLAQTARTYRTIVAYTPATNTPASAARPQETQACLQDKEVQEAEACLQDKEVQEAQEAQASKARALEALGVELLPIPARDREYLDLRALLKALAAREIDSLLVEGGGTLHASLFEEKLVDKVLVYVGGKLLGGKEAPTPLEGVGVAKMKDALPLTLEGIESWGSDALLTYRVEEQAKGEVPCSQALSKK